MNKVSAHALTGFVLYKQNVLLCESRQLVMQQYMILNRNYNQLQVIQIKMMVP